MSEDKPLRLSEAIRLGSLLRPQGKSTLFSFSGRWDDGQPIASCALGAAYEAATGTVILRTCMETEAWRYLKETFPIINNPAEWPQSVGGENSKFHGCSPLIRIIFTLNDHFGWTRTQIADYIATLEDQLDSPPVNEGAALALAATA